MNLKPQRIRDPLHDLIEFDTTEFEQGLWKVLDTAEFQRLRRIRQLGFSELVYPGATHTRFLHSVGVFHTARTLLGVAAKALGPDYDPERAKVALAAALVHDVGHGPFSHAFETATKQLAKRRGSKSATRHEIWTGEIIRGDTALGGSIEALLGEDGRKDVASLLLQETPTDIYSAIVSSQLDADRLDYIRRDRLMTGAQHGGFDFPWLLANLEVDEVTFATDDEEFASAQMLILGSKSFQAAEAFVLGLFHLYFAVYFHKATRSAEKMLTALLVRIGALCDNGMQERTGLEPTHPLVAFVNDATLGNYLSLDDSVIWGSLPLLSRADDEVIASLAHRILTRDLYKAVQLPEAFRSDGNPELRARLRAAIKKACTEGDFEENEVFEDAPRRSPYKRHGYDSPEALSKVFIRDQSDGRHKDLSGMSDVVRSLQEKSIYRIYSRDEGANAKIIKLAEEASK